MHVTVSSGQTLHVGLPDGPPVFTITEGTPPGGSGSTAEAASPVQPGAPDPSKQPDPAGDQRGAKRVLHLGNGRVPNAV